MSSERRHKIKKVISICIICCFFSVYATQKGYEIVNKYAVTGTDESFEDVLENQECIYGWQNQILESICRFRNLDHLKYFCRKWIERKSYSEAYKGDQFENPLYYVLYVNWIDGFDYLTYEYPELIHYSRKDSKSGKSNSPISIAITMDNKYYYRKLINLGANPIIAQVGNEFNWDCGITFKKNILSVCKDIDLRKELIALGVPTTYKFEEYSSGFSVLKIITPKDNITLYETADSSSISKTYFTSENDVYRVIQITYTEPRWFKVEFGSNIGWIKDWILPSIYYEP